MEPLEITIENNLVKEKRSINVFHQASIGSHLISHNGSIILPLHMEETGDYIHISITSGAGHLKNACLLDLPNGLDIEFSGNGKVFLLYKKRRVNIRIPPGPPSWQLKVTRPEESFFPGPDAVEKCRVILEEF